MGAPPLGAPQTKILPTPLSHICLSMSVSLVGTAPSSSAVIYLYHTVECRPMPAT